MSDAAVGFDQTEEEMLAYEVPDEALEAAAGTGERKSRELHALLLHCFTSLPRLLRHKPGPEGPSDIDILIEFRRDRREAVFLRPLV